MTASNAYYNAYFSISTDATKLDQVNYVSKYFTDKGYGVKIKQNPATTDTIIWCISW